MNQNQERIFIGVLLLVIGIGALFAAQSIVLSQYHEWSPMFISFGIMCIIVGFCVAVIGGALLPNKNNDAQEQASSTKPVRFCPQCNAQVPLDAHLCPNCGYDLLDCR